MIAVSSSEMREIERRAIEEFGSTSAELMKTAGLGVADCVRRLVLDSQLRDPFVLLIAGRGNNGGDAFVAARQLKKMGTDVEVWIAGSAAEITGDAALYLSKLKTAKVRVTELPTMDDWQLAIRLPNFAEIIVDGVLGTGIRGPARGPAAGAIQYIRSQAPLSLVVSIDVPSGLNADTGEAEGDVVEADLTATIGLPKTGLLAASAADAVGSVEVVDLNLSGELIPRATTADREMLTILELRMRFTPRARNSHKGDYGHVILIGGGGPYTGAIPLAARAATQSGAGLVTAIVPQSHRSIVATTVLEAMVAGAPESADGAFIEDALATIRSFYAPGRIVAVGPGMTRSPAIRVLVEAIIREAPGPLVVDADALTVMAGSPEIFRHARHPVILTPHPGEAAALLGTTAQAVQADRIGAAKELAERSGAIVVLKGAGTLVVQKDKPVQVCASGNPGMARGGMGDVLTGLTSSLLAQKFEPFDAACVAVYYHSVAGDLLAWSRGQLSMTPSKLIEKLSTMFHDTVIR